MDPGSTKITVDEMRGMPALSSDGKILGTIRNAVMNTKTGELLDIVVEPKEGVDPMLFRQDAQGNIVFPFENVVSVKDVAVIRTEVADTKRKSD
jgi:sporulation protein YlmC with PRC-barrel domain